MLGIDPLVMRRALESDGEFCRASRAWTGSFAFTDGAWHLTVSMANGLLTEVSAAEGRPAAEVVFTGPPGGWAKVFLVHPPPYYQDLLGGAVGRHGFLPTGDLTTMAAYYGAIQRAAVVAGRVVRGEA